MKYTSNIFHTTKRELYYQWHSNKIIIVFLLLVALSILHIVGLYNNVISRYHIYKITENSYIENDIDIIEALEKPSDINVEGNKELFINNPLKGDFVNLAISIQNLKPQNVIENTLEYIIFIFCTLLFGIYACYVATYDFKHKTYKFTSVYSSQRNIIMGKMLSVIIVMIFTLAVALLVALIGSFIVNYLVASHIPVEKYDLAVFNYEQRTLLQILLSILIVCFYIIIGYTIAFLLKSMAIPTIAMLLYGLYVPILGAYDFSNIFSYFSHKIFTFTARFVMFEPKPINEVIGITIPIISAIMLLKTTYVIAIKRSSYN